MVGKFRRRIGASAACLGAGLALSACLSSGGAADSRSDLVPANHKPQVLAHGTTGGKSWVLTVFSSGDGNLCLGLNQQLSMRALGKHDTFGEGGCGYGPPDDRGYGPTDEDEAGHGRLEYGPTPAGTVRVRLDTFRDVPEKPSDPRAVQDLPGCEPSRPAHVWVRITHRLPSWAERGGWFITSVDPNGCGYLDATFYDRSGHKLAEHYW